MFESIEDEARIRRSVLPPADDAAGIGMDGEGRWTTLGSADVDNRGTMRRFLRSALGLSSPRRAKRSLGVGPCAGTLMFHQLCTTKAGPLAVSGDAGPHSD